MMTSRRRIQEIRKRKAGLKAVGATYDDLAKEAQRSWIMVWMWMNGRRTSAWLQAAYERLTNSHSRRREGV